MSFMLLAQIAAALMTVRLFRKSILKADGVKFVFHIMAIHIRSASTNIPQLEASN